MESAPQAWSGRAAYGVDVQGDRVVAVRAERGRARAVLAAVPGDDPRFAADRARGIPVAAALGPRESMTPWLEVAFGARAKALKVLPTVLDIQLPFALEQCAYEFPDVRRTTEGRTRALGVAARLVDVERKLAALAAAGLDPVVLDHEGLALWTQSLEEMPGEAAGAGTVRVVGYRGVDRGTLVIGMAGEYRATHAVRFEDTAQVRRLIRAAAGGEVRGVTWWWAGPGAEDRQACEALLAELRREWPGVTAVHREPTTFLARALATRVVMPGPLRCNLRRGALEHPLLARQRGRGRARALAVALLAGVLLCAANLAATRLVRARVDAFDAAFHKLGVAVAGAQALGAAQGPQALTIAKRQVTVRRQAAEPYRHYDDPALSRLAGAIMETSAAKGLVIESLSLKPEHVSVAGRGPDWESAHVLVARIEGLGYKAALNRDPALPDATVPFAVTAEARHE